MYLFISFTTTIKVINNPIKQFAVLFRKLEKLFTENYLRS